MVSKSPKNTTAKLAAISRAYDKLMAALIAKQHELESAGEPTSSRAQARLSRLAREIESLERRVKRCEALQDATLCE